MTINNFQGGYEDRLAPGYPGMIATANARDAFSYTVEGAALGFGLAAGQGSADRGAVAGGSDFLGVAIADKTRSAEQYAVGETAGLLRTGVIWVTAATNVSPATAVTYDATGAFGDGLATALRTFLPNARFEGTASAGDLVRLYLG